ncbi:DUF4386 domain-containing protein [Micromonospora sp. GCM10011542]|uniref:DUF4386 domain-containing protein n=1 Tax=Micromonospora sp. GCM10011542 TaxID=3317337 RepID=UPI00361889DA
MTSARRTAMVAGVLFLVTHVTSVVALALYKSALHDTSRISGSDTPLLVGAFLEVLLVLAIIGTGVALFPVVKRQNEGLALGYVGLRTLEAGVIAAGIVPLLVIVTLRQNPTEAASADAGVVGSALVAFHDWTFLIGPSFVCGTNTVLLAYLLYASGLVPRFIAALGLVGGPLVFASGAAQMFGLYEQISLWAALCAIPVFTWEICLAVHLVVRGFRSPAAAALDPAPVGAEAPPVAA